MIEKNHLLSQVVQSLLTQTHTQSLNFYNKQCKVSFQVFRLKGLPFFIIDLPLFYSYSYHV